MHSGRRKVLQGTGGLAVMGLAIAAGLVKPGLARAEWNKEAFSTKSFAEAVKAMGGSEPSESKDIVINSPDIAENGAVVPFAIQSNVPNTQSIALLIEKNPNILAAESTVLPLHVALTFWMNQAGCPLRWPVSISCAISTFTSTLSPSIVARIFIGSGMAQPPQPPRVTFTSLAL